MPWRSNRTESISVFALDNSLTCLNHSSHCSYRGCPTFSCDGCVSIQLEQVSRFNLFTSILDMKNVGSIMCKDNVSKLAILKVFSDIDSIWEETSMKDAKWFEFKDFNSLSILTLRASLLESWLSLFIESSVLKVDIVKGDERSLVKASRACCRSCERQTFKYACCNLLNLSLRAYFHCELERRCAFLIGFVKSLRTFIG